MHILLTNDDGVNAKGLITLFEHLNKVATVTVIAPDRNCSGASNALTLISPLRATRLDNGFFSVNGTPTDCVNMGVNQLCEHSPDIVIAGINHGANLGDDTIYSGTVAAAIEGRHLGIPSIAISLCSKTEDNFDSAAKVLVELLPYLSDLPLNSNEILNLNIPDVPFSDLKGKKVTKLGKRHSADAMSKHSDPWGRDIYWYGKLGKPIQANEDTDFNAIENQYVSLTPLTIDMTAHESISQLNTWFSEKG